MATRILKKLGESVGLKERPKAAALSFEAPALRTAYEVFGVSADMNDDEFLDKIARHSFEFFWREASANGMIPDNLNRPATYSTASIGFGLSALVIGAERSYEDPDAIQARVLTTLEALDKTITKDGMFYHFLDAGGQTTTDAYETAISTVDTALLLMGVITVAEYFGGRIKELAAGLVERCNWLAFADPEHRQVFMAWEPDDKRDLTGIGKFHPVRWDYFTDEALLCTLLGIAAPNPEHRLPADYFYRWKREKGQYHPVTPGYRSIEEFVYSYSGALFTYQFAHLWIDFRGCGPDHPEKFGLADVPAVDWYENSRRAVQAAWLFAVDNSHASRTYGPMGWGFTAHTSLNGYNVGAFIPRGEPMPCTFTGEVATYGAGTSIIFDYDKAMKSLRYHYGITNDAGKQLVWNEEGDHPYGFYDAFNLDNGFVPRQYLGIDLGPMLLAIENYRSHLIQKTFMKNEHVRRAMRDIGYEL